MPAPLSLDQKRLLARLSDRAYNRLAAQARGRREDPATAIQQSIGVSSPSLSSLPSVESPQSVSPGGRSTLHAPRSTLHALRTAFRHHHVAAATGKLGLRCCSQDDFKSLQAHFLELLGEHSLAFNAHLQAATEPRRIAEFKVVLACKEFGYHLSYADAICQRQNHGAHLDEVSTKTLWHLFYTIRNRGLAKRRAEKQSAICD